MIKTKTSKEFMNILEESNNKISEIKDDLTSIRKELSDKLELIRNIQEYNEKETTELKTIIQNGLSQDEAKTVLLAEQELDGQFVTYGTTVMPAMSSTPNNIMNITSATGRIFKNNASIYINEEKRPDFIYALMNDSISTKNVAFDVFDDNRIELNIVMNPGQLLGSVKFNTIEILPFIPGSFDIEKVDILTMQDYKAQDEEPTYTLTTGMEKVGMSRIVVDKMDLWQCKITIKLNFRNSDGKYPFGLKHIYFLNAEYNTSSYVVAEVEKDSYIDWISEDIVIIDQYGKRNSTCKNEGIEIYAEKIDSNGTSDLMYKIKTSKGINQHSITRNITKLYVRIPIDRGIIAIKFNNIVTR